MDEVFDFSNLTAADVEEAPESSGGKRRKYENTPFPGWMKECLEKGIGKEVVVPPKMVKDVLSLIRDSAEDLGCGTRVRLYNKGVRINQDAVGELAPQAKVTVKFWSAEKKKYAPRQTASTEVTEETVAQ